VSRAGARIPAWVGLTLAGLSLLAGCGASTDSSNRDAGKSSFGSARERAQARAGQSAARQRAREEARRARARARKQAREAREKARLAARKARAASRRIGIRARTLARNGGDVDCGAFVTQAQAQRYLLRGDPFGLDADGDGVACGSLPCPCLSPSGEAEGEPGAGPVPSGFRGTVVSVADGDTLDVSTPSGSVETVRIIGIDTPEVYGGKECGGPVASAAMKRMAAGQRVTVTSDPTQDRRDHYGRLLAYIDKGNQDLGFTMVRRGLASAYPYDGPFHRYPHYAKADRRARNQDRGSWSRCDISPG